PQEASRHLWHVRGHRLEDRLSFVGELLNGLRRERGGERPEPAERRPRNGELQDVQDDDLCTKCLRKGASPRQRPGRPFRKVRWCENRMNSPFLHRCLQSGEDSYQVSLTSGLSTIREVYLWKRRRREVDPSGGRSQTPPAYAAVCFVSANR